MDRHLPRLFAAIAVLVLAAGCASEPHIGREVEPPDRQPSSLEQSRAMMRNVMQTKLLHSRMLMEAIALEDFDEIRFNANELAALSRESEWMVHTTERYVIFSERFRGEVEALAAAADRNDIDAVSRRYTAVTSSCLECHAYLRKEGLIRDLPGVVSWAPPVLDADSRTGSTR